MSDYKAYIRGLTCVVSEHHGDSIDPHHIKGVAWLTGGSTGKKASDLTCIPIRHDLHQELHQIGWKSFEKKYNISQVECMVRTILQAEKDGVLKILKQGEL